MSKGYVYILRNECMPGLVKIGRTTRSVEARAKEISDGTGVPMAFEIVDSFLFPDCELGELQAHEKLHEKRLSTNREFFHAGPFDAVQVVEDLQREMVEAWVEDFIPDQILIPGEFFFDVATLAEAAHPFQIQTVELVSALEFLSSEDLRGAIERYRACVAARREARANGEEMPPMRLVQ